MMPIDLKPIATPTQIKLNTQTTQAKTITAPIQIALTTKPCSSYNDEYSCFNSGKCNWHLDTTNFKKGTCVDK